MKKILLGIILIALTTVGLNSCVPGNNTPGSTIVGAAGGGLVGGLLGRGNVLAIAAGSLLGGGLGYMAGRSMDRQDALMMQNAITQGSVGQQTTWTNQRTNVTYQVTPTRTFEDNGNYCREYRTRVNIGGQWRSAFGRACRMPDGQWQITS